MILIRLTAAHPFLRPFDQIELPSLTVLTGINGSGKSLFLKSLAEGIIPLASWAFEGAEPMFPDAGHPPIVKVQLLDSSSVQPDPYSGRSRTTILLDAADGVGLPPLTKTAARMSFDQIRSKLLQPSVEKLEAMVGRPLGDLWPGQDPWLLDHYTVRMRGRSSKDDRLEEDEVYRIFEEANAALTSGHSDDPTTVEFRKRVAFAAGTSRKAAVQVTAEDLQNAGIWDVTQSLTPPLTAIFARYRDAEYNNKMQRVEDADIGSSEAFSPSEFQAIFGLPPWESVNKTIDAFGLPYVVVPPPRNIKEDVLFGLRRNDGTASIAFSDLSSGEKVLLRFALSLHEFDPTQVQAIHPHLLLLDEMDASLHPEMIARWLGAIQDGLVARLGINVILTTHSPVTVAMSPEDALFEMKAGIGGPIKVTKQEALNGLTVGLPTLAVDFAGRRQVVTESDTDAALFQDILAATKARLRLPRTLFFISAGYRDKLGIETNAGCSAVTHIVGSLSEHGARSVFGIVDWDHSKVGRDRIKVVGEGAYYSIENLLLDSLLVGALMLHERIRIEGKSLTFRELANATVQDLQTLATAVDVLLPTDGLGAGQLSDSRYQNGLVLRTRKDLKIMRGHDLEKLVLANIAPLKALTKNREGEIPIHIVRRVLHDYPEFCPAPIAEILEEIATVAD